MKITEEKVVFHTAGRINEIELPNLEKVALDGKTKGITTFDLIMRFIMKDGSTFSYSYLGMNTYLLLNKLSMMNIPIYEKRLDGSLYECHASADHTGHAAYEEAKDFNKRIYDFLKE